MTVLFAEIAKVLLLDFELLAIRFFNMFSDRCHTLSRCPIGNSLQKVGHGQEQGRVYDD